MFFAPVVGEGIFCFHFSVYPFGQSLHIKAEITEEL